MIGDYAETSGFIARDERIDIRDYSRTVAKRKWWLLIPFVVSVATGTIFALVAEPVYRSTATILLERPQQLTRDLGMLIQVASSNEEDPV